MKALVLLAVLASVSLSAVAADSPSLTGKWNVHSSTAGNESESVCTFVQNGAELAGSCKTDAGEAKATGKVDGVKVTWSFDSDYNGTALTLKYTGTLDPATGKIAGSLTVDPFGVEGEFTAIQAK